MQRSASRRARTPRAAVMLTGSLTCRPGEDSAARRTCAPQALVPVRVAEGPGEATPLPPKKKNKKPTADGRAHFQTTCTRHRVCPGHGFDPARGPGRLSPCTPRERGRSGTGAVGRPVCVGGRSTAIVTCASLSSAHPAAISPWPEASPRARAAPWGARRAQGVTRWGQRPAPGTSLFPGCRDRPPAPRAAVWAPVWWVACEELWLSPGRGREVRGSLGVLGEWPQKPAASPHLGDSFKVHFRIRTLDMNVVQPRRPSAPARVGVHATRDRA